VQQPQHHIHTSDRIAQLRCQDVHLRGLASTHLLAKLTRNSQAALQPPIPNLLLMPLFVLSRECIPQPRVWSRIAEVVQRSSSTLTVCLCPATHSSNAKPRGALHQYLSRPCQLEHQTTLSNQDFIAVHDSATGFRSGGRISNEPVTIKTTKADLLLIFRKENRPSASHAYLLH